MHSQPPLLQLRPETPSTGVQSARPAGRLRPRMLVLSARPAGRLRSGALVYRMPAPAGHPPPPHSPSSEAAGHFLALLSRCFLGHNTGPPAADLPISLLFWNLPSVHPPVLCPHHLAPWVPTPSTSEL